LAEPCWESSSVTQAIASHDAHENVADAEAAVEYFAVPPQAPAKVAVGHLPV
jgi:hypothetical protein